jgi:alpha-tubulin suppressor-like RCC1 family protein
MKIPTCAVLTWLAILVPGCGAELVETSPVEAKVGSPVVQLAQGAGAFYALLADGTVYGWGSNGAGQLGTGSTTESLHPTQVLGLDRVKEIAAASDFACALREGGEVFCWGYNSYGQLGDGTTDERHRAALSFADLVDVRGRKVRAHHLRLGDNKGCVLTEDAQVFCWGYFEDGVLTPSAKGEPSCGVPCYTKPVQVRLTSIQVLDAVIELAVMNPACALRKDGNVYCWGNNMHAQLGFPIAEPKDYPPRQVSYFNGGVSRLYVGSATVCVEIVGKISCWGSNTDGQFTLGFPDFFPKKMFAPPNLGPNIASFSIGGSVSCVIRKDRSLWCWGRNDRGQLGDGTTYDRFTPVPILTDVVEVTPSADASSAVHDDKDSRNFHGGAGCSLTVYADDSGGEGTRGIYVCKSGNQSMCARRGNGSVYCWGNNQNGELGLGYVDEAPHPFPQPVEGLR